MCLEDDSPPPAPAPILISPPQAPTVTASQSADAQVEAFAKLIPLLAPYAQAQTDIQKAQAPQLSQLNLDQQKIFGPQLTQLALDNLKTADPTGFSIRQKLGELTLGDLGSGGNLTDEELRQAQQDVRAGQVARGVGTGASDAIDEASFLNGLRFNREQQRRSNAASFLAGTPPQASFAALNSAGKTAPIGTSDTSGFAAGLFPSTNALIGNQAANYGTYAGFTSANNNLVNRQFEYNDQNTSNPFLTGLAAFGSFAAEAAPKSISI